MRDDQAFRLQYTRENIITLLQNSQRNGSNGSVLPLDWLPKSAKVLVVGPAGMSKLALCGGWSSNPTDCR